jgi:hypothetical protein
MTAYAIFATFNLGGLTYIICLFGYLAYQDGKALKALEKREEERHAALLLDMHYREDDQEQSAIDLVQDKLGGTILSQEKR